MMSKRKLSFKELKKVLNFPRCQIDGKVSNMAHIDINSARTKLGGIYVTVYPVIAEKIKGPREVRQSQILDSQMRKQAVSVAKDKKNKKKTRKRPLSNEKHLFKQQAFLL